MSKKQEQKIPPGKPSLADFCVTFAIVSYLIGLFAAPADLVGFGWFKVMAFVWWMWAGYLLLAIGLALQVVGFIARRRALKREVAQQVLTLRDPEVPDSGKPTAA